MLSLAKKNAVLLGGRIKDLRTILIHAYKLLKRKIECQWTPSVYILIKIQWENGPILIITLYRPLLCAVTTKQTQEKEKIFA